MLLRPQEVAFHVHAKGLKEHVAKQIWRRMRGGSHSLLVCDWNYHFWVVKFTTNLQHRRLVSNEYLATHIAKRIGLTVPTGAAIEVGSEVIQTFLDESDLVRLNRQAAASYTPGVHYGSKFVGGLHPGQVLDCLPDQRWDRVLNRDEAVGALVFDTWLGNNDGRQAVYAKQGRSFKLKAYWIDHGNCFGEDRWRLGESLTRRYIGQHPSFVCLKKWSDFDPWLSRIEDFPEQSLWDVFYEMPAAWRGDEERAFSRLLADLGSRKKHLRELLLQLIDLDRTFFPGWSSPRSANSFQHEGTHVQGAVKCEFPYLPQADLRLA